jgi:hypothetical protein
MNILCYEEMDVVCLDCVEDEDDDEGLFQKGRAIFIQIFLTNLLNQNLIINLQLNFL